MARLIIIGANAASIILISFIKIENNHRDIITKKVEPKVINKFDINISMRRSLSV